MLKQNPNINIRLHQGTVEEILSQVEQGISEIGVIYISQKHLTAFLNIISGKRMEFVQLDKLKACIYVGKENPLYNHSTINLEELKNLRYVRGLSDFFSIDDGLEKISLGLVNSDLLTPAVYTNSEHCTTNLLLHTDLVEIGISIDNPKKKQHKIKSLAIEGEDTNLCIGYVVQEGHSLSDYAVELINRISNILHP